MNHWKSYVGKQLMLDMHMKSPHVKCVKITRIKFTCRSRDYLFFCLFCKHRLENYRLFSKLKKTKSGWLQIKLPNQLVPLHFVLWHL